MDFTKFLLWAIVFLSAMAMTFTTIYLSENVSEDNPQNEAMTSTTFYVSENVSEDNPQNKKNETRSFWTLSTPPLCSIVGSVSSTLASEYFGKKNVLVVSNTLMILGLYEKVEVLTIIGLGAFTTTIPLFLSEAAPPNSGTFINVLYFTISVAHLLKQASDIKLDTVNVFWPQISLILSLIFLILYKAPSPKSFATTHWKKILRGYLKALKMNRQARLSLLGGSFVHASSQLIGNRFITYQNQKLLQHGVISRGVEFTITIILSIIGFVLESYFIKKRGRRFVVLLGLGLVGLSLAAEGTMTDFGGTGSSIIFLKWAGFVIFFCVYDPCMGATPWIIVSESHPRHYSGLITGVAAVAGFTSNWISTLLLPIKEEGKLSTYLLYCGICVLSFGLAFLVLPESAQNLRDKEGILQTKRKREEMRSFWVGQKKLRVRDPIKEWNGEFQDIVQLWYTKFGKNYFAIDYVAIGVEL